MFLLLPKEPEVVRLWAFIVKAGGRSSSLLVSVTGFPAVRVERLPSEFPVRPSAAPGFTGGLIGTDTTSEPRNRTRTRIGPEQKADGIRGEKVGTSLLELGETGRERRSCRSNRVLVLVLFSDGDMEAEPEESPGPVRQRTQMLSGSGPVLGVLLYRTGPSGRPGEVRAWSDGTKRRARF